MKLNVLVAILFFLGAMNISAQDFISKGESEKKTMHILNRKHEVRLGIIKLLAGGIIEGSYEYILDSNQGVGVQALINLDQGNDYFENLSLTPYYRMYFQTNEDYGAKGFFVEGFTSFFTSDYEVDDINYLENGDDVFDISIGLATGIKWINTAGFVFEIKLGAGRNLLGNAEFDALFKGDFYIGYRF